MSSPDSGYVQRILKNAKKPMKFLWILQTDGRSTFKSAFSDVFSNEPHVS